jgi:hypothetical protein
MTWKQAGQLMSRNEFCGTSGLSSLKSIQPVVSRENRVDCDPYYQYYYFVGFRAMRSGCLCEIMGFQGVTMNNTDLWNEPRCSAM